jgi:hypothetical protein
MKQTCKELGNIKSIHVINQAINERINKLNKLENE